MERIYMDNAATTRVDDQVLEKMIPYYTQIYGNASSVHAFGQDAKKALDEAREMVAKALGANAGEIIFTGCGTESDNTVILAVANANRAKGNHVITTQIEHHAVLHACEALEKQGFEVTYLPVDEYGQITAQQVQAAIKPSTVLVTVMAANNEVGTIQPIAQIGQICRDLGVLFHTDAVQAMGAMEIDVEAMHIDMLSLSAHKFHGPKGVGALYVRNGVKYAPFMMGGAQERKRRAGTENIAQIMGLAYALQKATADIPAKNAAISKLRDRLIAGVMERIPNTKLNGHPTQRLPNNVNFSFRFIEGESLLLLLDLKGIAGSSGSACTSGSLDPSHVLLAMGMPHEVAHGSLRLTLSAYTTEQEVDTVIEALVPIVQRLRDMSPLC